MIPLGVLASARVEAAGGWTPLDLTGLIEWHDANQPSSLTVDGSGNVTQWADLSGGANHMTGSTGVKADGTIAGRVALRTTGDTTFLESPVSMDRDPGPVHYLFMGVFAVTTDTSFTLLPTDWDRSSGIATSGGTTASYFNMSKTPAQVMRVNGVTVPSVSGDLWTATQDGPFLLTLQYVTTDTYGLKLRTPSGITGALVGEWILAKTTPDSATLSDAESYLMTKWGIA